MNAVTVGVKVDLDSLKKDRFNQVCRIVNHKDEAVVAEGISTIVTYDYGKGVKADIPLHIVDAIRRSEAEMLDFVALQTGGVPPLTFSDAFWDSAAAMAAKPRKWIHAEFTQPGRSDNLKLKHWVREDEPARAATATPSLNIPQYTEEEYSTHLQNPDWPKQETDYLIDMCRQFSLKFIVIADRYEVEGKTRSVEDLKERYYDVSGKLQIARSASTPILQPVFKYDKQRDIQRKLNLNTLYNRTPEAIKEEEYLFHELKRRELHERKWACERDYLTRILSNHELATPMVLPVIPGVPSALLADSRKKQRRPLDGSSAAPEQRRRSAVPAHDSSSALARKELPQGVFLRGHKLVTPRASNLQAKFKDLLEEYNLANPPNFPNINVCNAADEVRCNLLVLLDIKKTIEKSEADIQALRDRKRMILSGERPHVGSKMNGGSAGMLESESGDEYDAAEARRKRKSFGGGGAGSVIKKARVH
ncbi:DNA methyltransferase 1-associated protein 1 [Podochytrium sp. JEL0797]|nr:DNA methyltransferase 1-associated protein 1 [Podochytrium sp. JEL0797]